MTNQMSASHQVSISHDPLEERTSAGRDQLHGRGYASGDNWPSGGIRTRPTSSMLPAIDASDLRPVLLAGAIGLFAAWLVSGMSQGKTGYRPQARRGFEDRERGQQNRFQQDRPQQTRGPRSGYSAVGPEGPGSRGFHARRHEPLGAQVAPQQEIAAAQ
jgi:hypothetical protein